MCHFPAHRTWVPIPVCKWFVCCSASRNDAETTQRVREWSLENLPTHMLGSLQVNTLERTCERC